MLEKKRPKYFTPNEVSIHNTLKDLWVSFLGKVYDLTPLCEKHAGQLYIGAKFFNSTNYMIGASDFFVSLY